MEKEVQSLKSALRSLVVSSPAQVDVRSLQRDYRAMMGSPIPVHKFGYKDVLAFLTERCADCFLFQGNPSNPVLTLIVPDSLKHIDQFVQRQKSSAITKMKGKRRSVIENASRPPERSEHDKHTNLIAATFNKTKISTSQLKTDNTKMRPIVKTNNEIKPEKTNHSLSLNNVNTSAQKGTPSASSELNHKAGNGYHAMSGSGQEKEQAEYDGEPCASRKVHNFLKKRLPLYDSAVGLESNHTHTEEQLTALDDDDSGRQTASSGSSGRRAQLEQLTGELLELARAHAHGVLLADIARLYRERFGRALEPARAGFYNITGLLNAVDDRLAFDEGAGGVRMRDARAPPPPRLAPRPPAPARPPPVRYGPDDAMPGIDYEPAVFPADCMHYTESIAAVSLRDVRPGAMLEVAVGEVYSPSHFWLQRLGAEHAAAMHALMDHMSEYYSRGEGAGRRLARAALRLAHHCAARFEGDWHRALIVRILDADTVKVRHVDYGTVDVVRAAELKPLRREYGTLPAQAVRARLAGLRPGAAGRRWPHAAAAHFLSLVQDKHFIANVVAVNEEEQELETLLIDTSGEDDVCVTAEMVRAGHADRRADAALASGESYLFPRWEALESGATLNYAEIHRYLADGIVLDYVDAYRSHVPAALPAAPPPPAVISRAPRPLVDTPPTPAGLPEPAPVVGLPEPVPVAEVSGSPPVDGFPRPAPVAGFPGPAPVAGFPGPAPVAGLPEPPPVAGLPEPPPGVWFPGPVSAPGERVLSPLSSSERELFELLQLVDPGAAHCYMLSVAHRAAAADTLHTSH